MTSKVKVYGKAQNRTALGIMHAYLVMNPDATLEELRKAFPDALNPDSGEKEIFMLSKNIDDKAKKKGYFVEEDELLTTGNGKKIAVVDVWTKPSFLRLIKQAKQYGIEVADFANIANGKKGEYHLEYLDGYVPPTKNEPSTAPTAVEVATPAENDAKDAAEPVEEENSGSKKRTVFWMWMAIIALAILLLLLFLLRHPKNVYQENIYNIENVAPGQDSDSAATDGNVDQDGASADAAPYTSQLQTLEQQFNSITYPMGKTRLNKESKKILNQLAELMKTYPTLKIKFIGYASPEGSARANQRVSEARAKKAVDYLIAHGIAADRLSFEGMGENQQRPGGSEANRHADFTIIG